MTTPITATGVPAGFVECRNCFGIRQSADDPSRECEPCAGAGFHPKHITFRRHSELGTPCFVVSDLRADPLELMRLCTRHGATMTVGDKTYYAVEFDLPHYEDSLTFYARDYLLDELLRERRARAQAAARLAAHYALADRLHAYIALKERQEKLRAELRQGNKRVMPSQINHLNLFVLLRHIKDEADLKGITAQGLRDVTKLQPLPESVLQIFFS